MTYTSRFYTLGVSLLLLIAGCKKESTQGEEEEVFVDQGISNYADADPINDVMLQAFWWDSYSDASISGYSSLYTFLEEQIIALSNAHIDLLWLPPASEGEGMGYHPRRLFDLNSLHGSADDLQGLLEKIQSRKMHAMADLVFNHRVGTYTWTDFTEPAWSCESICSDDEGATNPNAFGTRPCGDPDEGESWGGARDLNHKSSEVQAGLKTYLQQLKSIGFDAWRYDFVKGFPAKYVATYNQSTPYYFSVGEYWDGNLNALKNWIDQTATTADGQTTPKTAVFDFALKYKLKEALMGKNYSLLNDSPSLAAIGYGNLSITFIDNHDTGCINRSDCDNRYAQNINDITQAYAYLLTHPGIPMIWGYHYWFTDRSGKLKKEVDELIKIRKEKGLHANSEVEVLEALNGNTGYYAAVIDNRLLVKLGSGDFQPPSGWQVIKSGTGYTLWEK